MIIKGNRHGNGAKLAAYLLDGGKHGERVAEPELHGFGLYPDDISKAFRSLDAMAHAKGIENPLFHIQIRLPQGEQMTREQWDIATARALKTAGLEGQPYARVFHTDEKTGELHCHLAASLIDEQTLNAKAVPFYKLRFKALSRALENQFDLTRVSNERDSAIRYGATRNEEQQAQRLGFDKEAVRNSIRNCWDATGNGHGFDDALAEAGLILAQGNRRNYVVIDPKGGVHSVSQRILDMLPSQIAAKLADLDRASLPTVEQARQFMLDLPRDRVEALSRELAEVQRQIETEKEYARRDPAREEIRWMDDVAKAAIAKEKIERQFVEPQQTAVGKKEAEHAKTTAPERELNQTAAGIRLAYNLTDTPAGFAEHLQTEGLRAVRAGAQDIHDRETAKAQWEKDESIRLLHAQDDTRMKVISQWAHDRPDPARRYQFADYALYVRKNWQTLAAEHGIKAAPCPLKGRLSDQAREGDVVILDKRGNVYELNERTTGESRQEAQAFLSTIDRNLPSIEDARREQRQEQARTAAPERELNDIQGEIRLAFSLSHSATGFLQNLDELSQREQPWEEYRPGQYRMTGDRVASIARMTQEESVNSRIDSQYADKPQFLYREGDYVVVTERGHVYDLARATGRHRDEIEKFMATADAKAVPTLSEARQFVEHRAELLAIERQAFGVISASAPVQLVSPAPQKGISTGHLTYAGLATAREGMSLVPETASAARHTAQSFSRAADLVTVPLEAAVKLATTAIDLLADMFGAASTPPPREEILMARDAREAAAEHASDFFARRERQYEDAERGSIAARQTEKAAEEESYRQKKREREGERER